LQETDIDEILMGMASQIAEKEDHIMTSDLRNSYYGSLHFTRRDWLATIIQVLNTMLSAFNTALILAEQKR